MQQLTKKTLSGIVTRLKKGSTTLGKESKGLGLAGNGPLRSALIEHLGNKTAYDEMMRKGREKRPSTKYRRRIGRGAFQENQSDEVEEEVVVAADEDDNKDDDDDDNEPQDLCTLLMEGEDGREEFEPNGTAGSEAEQLVSAVL